MLRSFRVGVLDDSIDDALDNLVRFEKFAAFGATSMPRTLSLEDAVRASRGVGLVS